MFVKIRRASYQPHAFMDRNELINLMVPRTGIAEVRTPLKTCKFKTNVIIS